MPAPTNTTSATAIVIAPAALPYSNAQQVDFAGTTHDVWYKITPDFDGVLSVFNFGDLVTYKPAITIFSPNDVTVLLNLNLSIVTLGNKPVQFPVTNGVTYWLKVKTNSGNPTPANLTLSVQRSPVLAFFYNCLLIPDDQIGFPLVGYNPTDGTTLHYQLDFPAGEAGDCVASGQIMVSDENTGGCKFFNSLIALVASVAFNSNTCIRANRVTSKFYATGGFGEVKRFTPLGVEEDVWAFNAANFCPSPDDSILYYTAGGSGAAIKQRDLATDTDLADLVAGIAGYFTEEMLALADGSILVAYSKITVTTESLVKHYSAAGATLATFTSPNNERSPRLAYDVDFPNKFWLWTRNTDAGSANPNGISTFRKITVSGLTTDVSWTRKEYAKGIYAPVAEAVPDRFAHSDSCPFFIYGPDSSTTGSITVGAVTDPFDDSFDKNFAAGGGLSPATFALRSEQERLFNSLVPGTYSIVEATLDNWVPVYLIDDTTSTNTAIVVTAGRNVTVVVLNQLHSQFSGLYRIVPDKRNDTYFSGTEGNTVVTTIPSPFIVTALVQNL